MQIRKGTIATGSRVCIPAAYRKALGLRIGDQVVMRLEDGEIRIARLQETLREAIEEAEMQDFPCRFNTGRREETERE